MNRSSILILVLALLTSSCAVQRSKAPQIDAKTAYALNLETQVTQANKDYTTFFTDVGNARRNRQLTDGDVTALNGVGHHLKGLLEEADRLTRAYAQSYDAGVAATIGSLLAQVAADLATLQAQIAQMKGGAHQ